MKSCCASLTVVNNIVWQCSTTLSNTSISIGFSSLANDFIASRMGRNPKHITDEGDFGTMYLLSMDFKSFIHVRPHPAFEGLILQKISDATT